MRAATTALGPIVAVMILSGCAPKTAAVSAPGAPHYPELAYPEPAPGMQPLAVERHQIGWQWLQSGDLKAAERSFSANTKDFPDFYPSETALAIVAMVRKDYKTAVTHFDRAISANATYVPALVGRGDAWLALGQRNQALASFVAAVTIDPGLTELQSRIEVLRVRALQDHVSVARKAAEEGHLGDARAAYEQAIVASPQSPFLHRELAEVERREGKLDMALEHAQKAATFEPNETRNLVLIGEIFEARGEYLKAADAVGAAVALEPNAELDSRLDDLREKVAFAALPPEYKSIESAETVTRAQLAALLGVRLDALLKRVPRVNAPVMTDTRGSWAGPWILSVTRAGVMEPFPNHTFQPDAIVRRADLAAAVSRVISLLSAENPARAAAWRNARHPFPDVAPGHLSYSAASVAVSAGVMTTAADGTFQLSRPVTGAEAASAIRTLDELSGRRSR